MRFDFKRVDGGFIMLVPPANQPLIDGYTGKPHLFSKRDMHGAQYGGITEVLIVMEAIRMLEDQQ